jgi:ribosomal protein S18 acetylase RimI-like enzyme
VTYVEDDANPYAEGLRAGEASFRMLAVTPQAQGRGVGEALVQVCLDRATMAERSAVFIYTGSWMPAARRLYRRLGFVRVPERDWEIPGFATLLGYWRGLPGPGEG